MTPIDIEKMNIELRNWNGAHAEVKSYTNSFRRLVIFLKSKHQDDSIGLALSFCTKVDCPVSWPINQLSVRKNATLNHDSLVTYELMDEDANVSIVFTDSIVLGVQE